MASSLSTGVRHAAVISYPKWVDYRWLTDENVKQESEAVMSQAWLRGTLVAVAKPNGGLFRAVHNCRHSTQRHTSHPQIEIRGTQYTREPVPALGLPRDRPQS